MERERETGGGSQPCSSVVNEKSQDSGFKTPLGAPPE